MKKMSFTLLAALLLWPTATFAASIYSTGGGQIKTTSESTADTGGNSVGKGGKIFTGSEQASVRSVTIVGNGTSSTRIETTKTTNKPSTTVEVRQRDAIKKNTDEGRSRVKIQATSTAQKGTSTVQSRTESSIRSVEPSSLSAQLNGTYEEFIVSVSHVFDMLFGWLSVFRR